MAFFSYWERHSCLAHSKCGKACHDHLTWVMALQHCCFLCVKGTWPAMTLCSPIPRFKLPQQGRWTESDWKRPRGGNLSPGVSPRNSVEERIANQRSSLVFKRTCRKAFLWEEEPLKRQLVMGLEYLLFYLLFRRTTYSNGGKAQTACFTAHWSPLKSSQSSLKASTKSTTKMKDKKSIIILIWFPINKENWNVGWLKCN